MLCFGRHSWMLLFKGRPWPFKPKAAAVVLFDWNTICFWTDLPGGSRENACHEITSCPSLDFYFFSSPILPPTGLRLLVEHEWLILYPLVLWTGHLPPWSQSWTVPQILNLRIGLWLYAKYLFLVSSTHY